MERNNGSKIINDKVPDGKSEAAAGAANKSIVTAATAGAAAVATARTATAVKAATAAGSGMKPDYLNPAHIVITKDMFKAFNLTNRKTGRTCHDIDIRLITPVSKSSSIVCVYEEDRDEVKEVTGRDTVREAGGARDLSVMKEVGIIRDYNELNSESRKLVAEALDKKYFIPNILGISSITEEFQMRLWKTETDKGYQEFYTRSNNDIFVRGNEVFIKDIDSNRYVIKDYSKLDLKSQKILRLEI